MKKNALVLILLSVSFSVMAQNVRINEKITYSGLFEMSSLWTNIAEIRLNMYDASTSKAKLYRAEAIIQTYKSWDSYFMIRDNYQSWISPTNLRPLLFKRSIHEGDFKFNRKYVFKRKSGYALSTYERNGKTETTKPKITSVTHDMISALVNTRFVNYPEMKKGQRKTFTVLIDDKLEKINITYLGTQQLDVSGMGPTNCYVIGVSILNEKIVKNDASNKVWITTDSKRIPVQIMGKIPAGAVLIKLKSYQ